MPATRALRGDLIGFLVRFARRNGVLRTAAAGGLATAAASALLCYAAYLALGWPFTLVAMAMPIVAPLVLAPTVIVMMAKAMARLDASEEALTRATEASGVMLWEADLRTGLVALSANWGAFLGQAAAPVRMTVADLARLVHPADLERVVGAQMEMLKGLRPHYAAEHRVRAATGEWRWVLSRGRVTEREPASGRVLRTSGTNIDITERRRAEEALRASEAKLAAAQAMGHIGSWEYDLLTDELAWSDEVYRIYGHEPRSFTPRFQVEYLQATHPDDRDKLLAALARVLRTRERHAIEQRIIRPDGSARVVDVRAEAVQADASGKVTRIFGVVQDITERKRAEEALRRSGEELEQLVVQRTAELSEERQRLQSIIDNVPDIVFVADADHRHVVVNRAAADLVGAPRGTLIGKLVGAAQPGLSAEEKARMEAHHREVLASGSPASRYESVRRDPAGRTRHFRVQKLPLKDPAGKARLVLTVANDITELKLAEEELRRLNEELEKRVAERTAALSAAVADLESFSYSVSHDLRAPARAVAGFARIVADDYGSRLPEDGRRMLARISRAGEAMGAMVDGLLELSRVSRGELERHPVDMVLLAAEVWRDLSAVEPGRRVEFHMDADLRAVGDPVLLRNLLLNLLGNARKYSRSRAGAAVWLGRTPEGELYVRDNGVGFDMAHAAKLFGAFRRLHTEREFEGHGIGLALCRKIVERHGGRIRAEAEPGKGAAVFFTLP